MSRCERLLRQPLATLSNSLAMRVLNVLSSFGMYFQKEAKTFFGERMIVIVPSGYGEVYLDGATVDADAEVRLNKFLLRDLAEGGVFFDVGACLGYYTLLASRLVGPRGSVHAFEPSPPLISLLRRNLSDKTNAHVVSKALSGIGGFNQFYVAPLPFIGTSSLRADWQKCKTELVTVETIRLDDYCDSTGIVPDIIKLDVEGVEDDVLKGAEKLLREKAPIIVVELCTPLIESDRKALQLLKQFGYAPYAIKDDGRLQALDDETIAPYLASLLVRYQVVQDSPNNFDNMVFKRHDALPGSGQLL